MQQVTSIKSTEVRQVRDCQDVQKLIDFLNDASPFSGRKSPAEEYHDGMVASDNVNADKAKDIEQKILDAMNERNIAEISFKRKDQIVQLSTKQSPLQIVQLTTKQSPINELNE